MRSTLLLVCPLLLAAVVSQEEPNACLLQQGSSPLQRAVLVQEVRQHPTEHGDSNGKYADNAGQEPGAGENDGSKDGEKPNKESAKEEEKKTPDEKHGEKSEKKEGEEGRRRRRKEKQGGAEEKQDEDLTSLRLELRLHVSVGALKGTQGSLPVFLDRLQKALVKAASIPDDRLDVLGIRGEYSDEGVLLEEVKASLSDSPVLAERADGGKSTVDLEVLPGADPKQPSPRDVFSLWKEQLKDKDSPLMKGPLKGIFLRAKLAERAGVEGLAPHHAEESGATHNGQRLLPLIFFSILCSALVL